jgi:hypothetical protein
VGGSSSGKLVYRLAEKRCANFGTCGIEGDSTTGTAKVNLDLLPLFNEGARLLERGSCDHVRPVVDKITSLMTVPLVQGTLRYAYKIGVVAGDRSQKNAAEGATFAAAVLPMLSYCNPASAKVVSDNVAFGLFDAGTYPEFATVKSAIEATYPCLGITCGQVGELQSGGSPLSGAGKCTDKFNLKASFTAAGTVSDFTAATCTSMAGVVADKSGLTDFDASTATCDVTAASVNVVITLPVDTLALATSAASTFAAAITSKDALTQAFAAANLDVTVETAPITAAATTNTAADAGVSPSSPSPSPAPKDDNTITIVLAVVIPVAVLLLIGVGFLVYKQGANKKGKVKSSSTQDKMVA